MTWPCRVLINCFFPLNNHYLYVKSIAGSTIFHLRFRELAIALHCSTLFFLYGTEFSETSYHPNKSVLRLHLFPIESLSSCLAPSTYPVFSFLSACQFHSVLFAAKSRCSCSMKINMSTVFGLHLSISIVIIRENSTYASLNHAGVHPFMRKPGPSFFNEVINIFISPYIRSAELSFLSRFSLPEPPHLSPK